MDRLKSIRRGFSLIESAIVLGVVGLVVAGIWVAAANMYENKKVDDLVSETMSIFYKAQELYPRIVDDVVESGDPAASIFVPDTWRKMPSNSFFEEPNFGHTVSFNINASTHYIRVDIAPYGLDYVKGSVCIKLTKGLIRALDAVKLPGAVQIVRAHNGSDTYTYQINSGNFNYQALDSVAQNRCQIVLFERYF